MEQATYSSRLRYMPAKDLDDSSVDFDGLDVRGSDNERLGELDGVIVSDSGRILYIVLDSGGWFTSRRLLLPIGHATVDRDARTLRVDKSKDVLKRYPEFDLDGFKSFSDDDLKVFDRLMAEACCPDETTEGAGVATASLPFETRRHYAQPEWWKPGALRGERLAPVEVPRAIPSNRIQEQYDRERVTALEGQSGDDVSPHLEGRAQPGDVLGLETGGERTYIGDTADDEDKRRAEAERAAREADEGEPRRSER